MSQNWEDDQLLPNLENVEIDPRKFVEYSMNPSKRDNQGKWMAFEAIGYNLVSEDAIKLAAQDVITQLYQQLPNSSPIQEKSKFYGIRFEIQFTIIGPNGKQGILITKWQIDQGKITPRLITNWLKVSKNKE